MATDVIMPQMGESIAEGTITKWLKKPGDDVERDEPLFEISTDKVDAEIPAPIGGTLLEIKVPEGETVEVNTVVASIGESGESSGGGGGSDQAEAKDDADEDAEKKSSADTSEDQEAKSEPQPKKEEPKDDKQEAKPEKAAASGGELKKPFDQYSPEELRARRSSPVVRNMAEEHGIDIADVEGTGSEGRVTKKDMEKAIKEGTGKDKAEPAAKEKAAPQAPAPQSRPAGDGVVIPDLQIPPFVQGEPVEIEPMSVMRKKIAEHMQYSKTVSAHVTSFFEVDMETVAKQRKSLKEDFQSRGAKLTYMPFILRAIVDGLRKFPYLNAAVMGDQIVFKKEINLGIAVALEDGKGLIVPVIRNADTMNLFGLAKAINDLGERARSKQLSPDEVQRGTFSITNPGVYGGLMGTPIINQPQVAILGVGAIKKRPVVIDDAIAIRHMCYLTLSYDHRLVDGAMAEMFMAFVKEFLEAGNIQ